MPKLLNGWVFLGDLSKWVPVSTKRFLSVEPLTGADGNGIGVDVACVEGEVMDLTALKPHTTGTAQEWTTVIVRVDCKYTAQQTVCMGLCLE